MIIMILIVAFSVTLYNLKKFYDLAREYAMQKNSVENNGLVREMNLNAEIEKLTKQRDWLLIALQALEEHANKLIASRDDTMSATYVREVSEGAIKGAREQNEPVELKGYQAPVTGFFPMYAYQQSHGSAGILHP
jgi:hypothetical protein